MAILNITLGSLSILFMVLGVVGLIAWAFNPLARGKELKTVCHLWVVAALLLIAAKL